MAVKRVAKKAAKRASRQRSKAAGFSVQTLRDNLYLWLYVTISDLDNIKFVDEPTKAHVDENVLRVTNELKVQGAKVDPDQYQEYLRTIFKALLDGCVNNEFGDVKKYMLDSTKKDVGWSGTQGHPLATELDQVFFPSALATKRKK
jgi:hypothetical protein